VTGLAAAGLSPGTVTLPKVQAPEQVQVAVALLGALEARTGVTGTALELQVETAPAVVDADGRITVPLLLAAGRGRVTGLHFGPYDYTAALGLSPREQALDAPVADAAKDLLQLSAAARGVAVSDGSSNVLPVGDRAQVHAAWALHARLVERGTARGLWQGWDLHPGQLVSRWATLSAFFRERLPEVRARLAGTATGVADEPATWAMLDAFTRRAAALGISG
jgi:citrate lyase beta subunit